MSTIPPPPDQASIPGRKHNSATQCANPQCSKELLYFREGTLELLELEPQSDDRAGQNDGAFTMSSLPSRFFWLCGECTKTYILKRWTTSGLVLALRSQKVAGSHPLLVARPAATTRPGPVAVTAPRMAPTGSGFRVLDRKILGPKAG
jgi:hypothetical protein